VTIASPGSATDSAGIFTMLGGQTFSLTGGYALKDYRDATIYVIQSTSIQSAINGSENLDTILVGAGTYAEALTISKDVTVKSQSGAGSTTISGVAATGETVRFTANGVTLGGVGAGFTINNQNTADGRAIAPTGTTGGAIVGNTIVNALRGIQGQFYGDPQEVSYGIAGTEGMSIASISGNTFNTSVEGIGLGAGVTIASPGSAAGSAGILSMLAAQTFSDSAGYAAMDYRVSPASVYAMPGSSLVAASDAITSGAVLYVGDGSYTGQVLTLDTTLSIQGTSSAVIPQIVLAATANVTNAATAGVESALVTVNADASLVQGYGLTASGGTTVMSGSFTGSTDVPATLTLAGSGSLTGTLTLGTSSAIVSPGIPSSGTGTITAATIDFGNATAVTGGTLAIDIVGPGSVAGTDYDQVIGQTVAIGGTTLALSKLPAFFPATGTVFTIVNNLGSSAIVGQFLDGSTTLSEGTKITVDGVEFRISYVGGDGNDVTLTVVDETPTTAVYVGLETSFTPENPSDGQVVSWTNGVATVNGLIFGLNAFTSVAAGVGTVDVGGTVNIAPGTYGESVTIVKSLTLAGTSAVIDGTLSFGLGSALGSGSGGVTASIVELTKGGLTSDAQAAVNEALGYLAGSGTLELTGSTPFAANVIGSGTQNLTFEAAAGLLTTGSTISSFQTVSYAPISSALTLTLSTYSSVASIVGSGGTTTLVAASGDTTFNVTGSNSGNVTGGPAFSSIESLQGGTGNDTFAITGSGSLAGTIVGGDGTDRLTYASYSSNVSVSLAASTASGLNAGVTGAFSGIEEIVGSGNAGDGLAGYASATTFTLAGGLAGVASGTDAPTVSFSGFETLAGGPSINVLVASGAGMTFNVTGTNAGNVTGDVAFTGIGSLEGAAGNDSFVFGASGQLTGSLAGGTGTDTLNYSARSTPVSVNLGTGTATAVTKGISAIEAIVGGSGTDTLTGTSGDDTFALTSPTAGTVAGVTFSGFEAFAGGAGNDTLSTGFSGSATVTVTGSDAGTVSNGTASSTFSQIGSLTGSANPDTFNLAVGSLSGSIVGGDGGDTLSYAGRVSPVSVNLGTGAATSVAGTVTGVESFVGGSGTDTLTGTSDSNAFALTGPSAGTVEGVSFSSFESLAGGGGSDTLSTDFAATFTTAGSDAGTVANGSGSAAFSGIGSLVGSEGNDTFNLAAGSLSGSITGGEGTDTLTYAGRSGNVSVNLTTGAATHTGGISGIESFIGGSGTDTITGTAGDNTFTLNGSASGTITDDGVNAAFSSFENLVGGNDQESDTLVGTNDATTFTLTGTGSGTISGGPSFSLFRNLTGGTGNDTFLFNAGGQLLGDIDGGAGFDTLSYAGRTGDVNVDLGLGEATDMTSFTGIESFIGIGGSNSRLRGTDSDDTFTLTGPGSGTVSGGATASFANFGTIRGEEGNNTLVDGTGTASTFAITGSNAGTLTSGSSPVVSFTKIQHVQGDASDTLSYAGQAGNVTVDLQSGAATNLTNGFAGIGNFIGGSGTDTLVGTDTSDTFTLTGDDSGTISGGTSATFSGFEVISGGGEDKTGNDTLIGTNADTTYSITGFGSGFVNGVLEFRGMNNITGGSGNDAFVIGSSGNLSGVITGGGGTDTLNYSGVSSNVSVNLSGNIATRTGGISGIESFIGGSGTDTIAGSTTNDTFTLTGAYAGTISGGVNATFSGFEVLDGSGGSDTLVGTDSPTTYNVTGSQSGNLTGSVAFSSIESLVGGAADDTFVFGAGGFVSGSVNGGGGANNTLDYSGRGSQAVVNLTNGTATGTGGISNIQAAITAPVTNGTPVITGSNANDVLTGGPGNDYIVGGGGTDIISGGAGDDYLVGGSGGNNTLSGGTGNDTFVVGSSNDTIIELPNQGNDTVRSAFDFTLPANVENLILTGSGNINGTGNTLNNILTGNSGNNTLTVVGGSDVIDGGAGIDTVAFPKAIGSYVFAFTTDGRLQVIDTTVSAASGTTTITKVEFLSFSGGTTVNVIGAGAETGAGTGTSARTVRLVGQNDSVSANTTISDAVAASDPNDIIVIAPGEYQESVAISKNLSLFGTQGFVNVSTSYANINNGSVLQAQNDTAPALSVTNNATVPVYGLSIVSSSLGNGTGVSIADSATNVTIRNSQVSGFATGILVAGGESILSSIANSVLTNNTLSINNTAGGNFTAGGVAETARNWWGTISSPSGQVSSQVTFDPWIGKGDPEPSGPVSVTTATSLIAVQAINAGRFGTNIVASSDLAGVTTPPNTTTTITGTGGRRRIGGGSPAVTIGANATLELNSTNGLQIDGLTTSNNGTVLTGNISNPTIVFNTGSKLVVNTDVDVFATSAPGAWAAFQFLAGSDQSVTINDPANNTVSIVIPAGSEKLFVENLGSSNLNFTGFTFYVGTPVGMSYDNAVFDFDGDFSGSYANMTFQTLVKSGTSAFTIEDSVYHKLDDASKGLVTWNTGNVYVTQQSGSIQRGVDAAVSGTTVNIQGANTAGFVYDAFEVNKPVTLVGSNTGTQHEWQRDRICLYRQPRAGARPHVGRRHDLPAGGRELHRAGDDHQHAHTPGHKLGCVGPGRSRECPCFRRPGAERRGCSRECGLLRGHDPGSAVRELRCRLRQQCGVCDERRRGDPGKHHS